MGFNDCFLSTFISSFQDKISESQGLAERSRYIADNFGMDSTKARKIWTFGGPGSDPNLLVDATKGVQGIQDSRDSIVAAAMLVFDSVRH